MKKISTKYLRSRFYLHHLSNQKIVALIRAYRKNRRYGIEKQFSINFKPRIKVKRQYKVEHTEIKYSHIQKSFFEEIFFEWKNIQDWKLEKFLEVIEKVFDKLHLHKQAIIYFAPIGEDARYETSLGSYSVVSKDDLINEVIRILPYHVSKESRAERKKRLPTYYTRSTRKYLVEFIVHRFRLTSRTAMLPTKKALKKFLREDNAFKTKGIIPLKKTSTKRKTLSRIRHRNKKG